MNLLGLKRMLRNIGARWRDTTSASPKSSTSDSILSPTTGMEYRIPDTAEGIYRGYADAEQAIREAKVDWFEQPAKVPPVVDEAERLSSKLTRDDIWINWDGISEFMGGLTKAQRDSLERALNQPEIKELTGWRLAYVVLDLERFQSFTLRGCCRCGAASETTHDARLIHLGVYMWFWDYVIPKILSKPHCCFDPENPRWRVP